MSKFIANSIKFGIEKLQVSAEKYRKIRDLDSDKYDSLKIANMLLDDTDPLTKAKNKLKGSESYIDYIEFISKQLNKINNFVECDNMPDFNHECIYFGTNTLYYNEKLLNYSQDEIFDIILNHIIHYSGALYLVNSQSVRLSYIYAAMGICYGDSVNFKDGRYLYEKNIKNINHIIFDINDTYQKFIFNNIGNFSFISNFSKREYVTNFYCYRCTFGNVINLKTTFVKIDNTELTVKESNLDLFDIKSA